MRHALNAPLLERWSAGWQLQQTRKRDYRLLLLGLVLLVCAGLVAKLAGTLLTALAGMAFLLLGAAPCLPAMLRLLVKALGRALPMRDARLGWLMADSRWLLGPAALALMAMTLALVANSGLNTTKTPSRVHGS